MPLGKFGEVIGTMNTFPDGKSPKIDSKVVAPKNPKLLHERAPYVKLTPSEFMFQMTLNTQQKLANTRTMELPDKIELLDMSNTTYQKTSTVTMDQPIFQPFPSKITFVNCEANETHEVPLLLRNNDKVPRLVRVGLVTDSPYFRVIPPLGTSGGGQHKIAAGLASTYRIQYLPDRHEASTHDLFGDLLVTTEREKFVVPVHCIGARALLDFPDRIWFGDASPVKYKEPKTVFVRNVGSVPANFSITTNGPFSVEPNAAVIQVQEGKQITVYFEPQEVKSYSEELIVHLDTGEDLHISLEGAGKELGIRLEKSRVTLPLTYVGLCGLQTVTLHNRSDYVADFHWSTFGSEQEEEDDRRNILSLWEQEEAEELRRFEHLKPTQEQENDELGDGENGGGKEIELLASDKTTLVTRGFLNRRRLHQQSRPMFSHPIFSIDPPSGTVWPHSSIDLSVAFRPPEAREYSTTAFLCTTGRQTRLSLRMQGRGLGPRVDFSFSTLNLGLVFVHSRHSYELLIANKGDIDALFKIEAKVAGPASSCFSFVPDDGLVSPGGHQAVQIKFHSERFLGEFDEVFQVRMDGCVEASEIRFRGTVIAPTFNFNVPKIRFGMVSLGFPSSKEVIISNTSLVPLKFNLGINSDSVPVDNTSQFTIVPPNGTIEPKSNTTIKLTFVGTKLGKLSTWLNMDLPYVPDSGANLPISAHVTVPEIRLDRDVLDLRRCFLRHQRIEDILLINESELPARYALIEQNADTSSITYRSSESLGILDPQSQKTVPIEIKALVCGEISTNIRFTITGSKSDPLNLHIKCVGEGPVVNLNRSSLDWGTIGVLEDKMQTLVLSNESDIPAQFSTRMVKEKESVFRVSPELGILEPHNQIELEVTAHLTDSLRFSDELQIQVEEGPTLVVELRALGHGTTVVFEPPLPLTGLGCWRLEDHFSKRMLEERVRIINCGRRHQQLVWSNEGYSYSKAIRQGGKGPKMRTPVLTVHPHRFDLSPGEGADMFIRGSVDKPQLVTENIICHAIIGKQGGKELIKKLELQVNFIAPVMQYSDQKIHFRIDKVNSTELDIISKSFSLCNVSGLPVTCTITAPQPFSLLDDHGASKQSLTIELNKDDEETISVQFDPLFKQDYHSRKVEEFLKVSFDEHPHTDDIKLIGEVNFPNLAFDRGDIDFDCILNHSEVTQFVTMTNPSPLSVNYRWSFVIGDSPNIIFHRKRPQTPVTKATSPELEREEKVEEVNGTKQENQSIFDLIIDACEKDTSTEKKSQNLDEEMRLDIDLSDDEHEEKAMRDSQPTQKLTPPAIKPIRRESTLVLPDSVEQAGTVNSVLRGLLDEDFEVEPLGIEEVFDIKPLFGTLGPGESERLELTFFGHADIEAEVVAQCEVEGGPSYLFQLKGRAGGAGYLIPCGGEFDVGAVKYQTKHSREVVIENTGCVSLEWEVTSIAAPLNKSIKTNTLEDHNLTDVWLEPSYGRIDPGQSIILNLYSCPKLPGNFYGTCNIQIGHFPPETLTVIGYATFPRLQIINLPRDSNEEMLDVDSEDIAVSNVIRNNSSVDKIFLPGYILDFDSVILGDVISKTVSMWNNGAFSVTVKLDSSGMIGKGFEKGCNIIKNISPGEGADFKVKFDPRVANLGLGPVSAQLILHINDGPSIPVILQADVTMPDLIPGSDIVDFKDVQVGQAMLANVQLHNPTPVVTQWAFVTDEAILNATSTSLKGKKTKKKKAEELIEKQCPIFEIIPHAGELYPDQKLNIQVKFTPLEGKKYSQRLVLHLNQSSKRVVLRCIGTGLEPHLEFTCKPQPGMLHFGPVLPFTGGDEQILTVTNPCSYPIEFYNLELDEQYEKDEEILRSVSGYDSYGCLLIPPRLPGDTLPPEFMDHFKKLTSKVNETGEITHELSEIEKLDYQNSTLQAPAPPPILTSSRSRKHSSGAGSGRVSISTEPPKQSQPHLSSQLPPPQPHNYTGGIDDMEQTPVSMAISRYLGIELTPEGWAARRSRGIAIVVMGSPISGKTGAARILADKYSASLVTIDDIIKCAIEYPQTPSAQKARELCLEATRKHSVFAKVTNEEGGSDTKQLTGTVANVTAIHSVTQNRKTSTVSTAGGGSGGTITTGAPVGGVTAGNKHGPKASQSGHKQDAPNNGVNDINTYILTGSSPPPITTAPVSTKLGIFHQEVQLPSYSGLDDTQSSALFANNTTPSIELESCILPDDVMIQLISERLMRNDCGKGVVFDGLESVFCHSQTAAAQIILHALNNRRFMYFVTLKKDYRAVQEAHKQQEHQNQIEEESRKQAEMQWLREMSEEEWEQLPDEKRQEFEKEMLKMRLEKWKKKKIEEEERKRREVEEKEAAEREKLEREKQKGKGGKKPAAANQEDRSAKKNSGKETSLGGGKTTRENTVLLGHKESSSGGNLSERPESHMTHMSVEGEENRKKGSKSDKKSVIKIDDSVRQQLCGDQGVISEEVPIDPKKEEEFHIHQKFKTFDHEYAQIKEILSRWDRCHPPMKPSPSPQDGEEETVNASNKKSVFGGRAGANTTNNKAAASKGQKAVLEQQEEEGSLDAQSNSVLKQHEETMGVPNVVIDVPVVGEELPNLEPVWEALPGMNEVLEGLGLGSEGPPVPPMKRFSLVKYPMKRSAPDLPDMFGERGHYTFLPSQEDIDTAIQQQREAMAAAAAKEEREEDSITVTSRSSKKALGGGKTSSLGPRKASGKKSVVGGGGRKNSVVTTQSSAPTPSSEDGHRPSPTRWIVQPNSSIELKLRFRSDELGQFDMTLNFELLDTRRKYQVLCRGICAFPSISREPRIVFPSRKRNREYGEIIHKKYVLEEEVFMFGPLLRHKDKQTVINNKYPDNYEEFTVQNKSPLPVEVNFSLRDDVKNERFFIKPPKMNLEPQQSQQLTVWAFPRENREFLDAIVCCIKENPEPVLFNISCQGVEPQLEIDKKLLQFDRVLLHRKDMKQIYMQNPTLLPINWQLGNLESLGDEFSFAQDRGTIEPMGNFALNAYFRSIKPYKLNQKKNIRIDTYDVEEIAGLLNTETIIIQAEAYDVALDMSFPRGANNGIDMGMVKAGGEEVKQQITIKNRGPYEIKYKFILDSSEEKKYLNKLFTLTPNEGSLSSGEKATMVQIAFSSKEEVHIKNEEILRCQLVEPNVGGPEGEEVASIPIRVSAKAVYSKFSLTPQADINFGAVVVQSKKTRHIILANTGEYDFKFNINHVNQAKPAALGQGGATKENQIGAGGVAPVAVGKDGAQVGPGSMKSKPSEGTGTVPVSIGASGGLIGGSQGKLQVGSFIIYPASCIVPIKQSVDITVDCIADNPGVSDEQLMIDISDRNPQELSGHGIPYRLFVETFVPSIDMENYASIFEEHRIVETLSDNSLKQIMQTLQQNTGSKEGTDPSGCHFGGGCYGRVENRFEFGAVLVGKPVEARIRLDNPCRVPCDIAVKIHGASTGHKGGRGSTIGANNSDVFKIEPSKAVIEPRGCLYVTITFSPLAMQQYTSTFECSVEGLPQNSPMKSRNLSFELSGEGYLPRVSLMKPRIRNKRGQPLLLFNRTQLNKIQTLPIELLNDGALNARIHLDIMDPDNAFWVTMDESDNSGPPTNQDNRPPHDIILSMDVASREQIFVKFKPLRIAKFTASLKISTVNNQYENTVIIMVGEGYDELISFENLPEFDKSLLKTLTKPPKSGSISGAGSSSKNTKSSGNKDQHPPTSSSSKDRPQSTRNNTGEEEIAGKNNQLFFGECQVGGNGRSISFNITNYSDVKAITDIDEPGSIADVEDNQGFSVRYAWPSNQDGNESTNAQNPPISFSPTVGHLHPGQTARITATLMSDKVKSWTEKVVQCKLTKISFPDLEKGQKPLQWDDSKKTIRWIDSISDIADQSNTQANNSTLTSATRNVRKKRVIETEPEPSCIETANESPWNMDLLVTAFVDYCLYECSTTEIFFQDTNLFEKRIYGVTLKNTGVVTMRYRWEVVECERSGLETSRSSAGASAFSSRPSSAAVGGYLTSRREGSFTERSGIAEELAFYVVPNQGVILAGGEEVRFEVVFSPLAVQLHRAQLRCHIDNTESSSTSSPLVIPVRGRALQPHCHFELAESNYLDVGRRDPTMRGPGGSPPGTSLDPDTRVLELQVVGVGSRNSRRFNVVNPTRQSYSYHWVCEDLPHLKSQPTIVCFDDAGTLDGGCKVQCGFQFNSDLIGITESFWRFEIPSLGIRVPFLIVGECKEPSVAFSKTHFKFPALLVGQESVEQVQLVNMDGQSYQFSFHEASRHGPGHSSSLRIDPCKGSISAHGTIDVSIGFKAAPPSSSGLSSALDSSPYNQHNFNLVCEVEKMSCPLTLNVKAVSYNVQSSLWIESPGDGKGEPAKEIQRWMGISKDEVSLEEIDFGRLELQQERHRGLVLVNSGSFELGYDWSIVNSILRRGVVKIEPERGRLEAGQKKKFQIIVLTQKPINIRKEPLILQIEHGPQYRVHLSADIRRPVLAFSFDKHDFGSSFPVDRDSNKKVTLVMENKEASGVPVSVEVLENELSQLTHDLSLPHLLKSGEKLKVNICWKPTKPGQLKEQLCFLVGSSRSQIHVKFTGHCEQVQVEAHTISPLNSRATTRIHTLDIGSVQVRQSVVKTLKLFNRSQTLPVKGKLVLGNTTQPNIPVNFKPPLGTELTLQPMSNDKEYLLQVAFNPTERISKFSEELHLEIYDTGNTIPLFIVTGSCHGHEIRLDVDSISFGLVTKGSAVTRNLLLINSGDIGDKFSWNTKNFKPDFSISPSSGYISPGMKVPISVSFHPTQPAPDIRYDNLKCSIENWKQSLPLTLTGVCQAASLQKENLHFSCQVRLEDTKSLKINNPSNGAWLLRPVIDGAQYWYGAETFTIEPQTVAHYELTYRPITMTQDKKHQGSVFFPLPDGSGLLFGLTGTADPPKARVIRQEVPARTKFDIPIKIEGWKTRAQRFVVSRELGKADKGATAGSGDCGITMRAYDWIEVPGGKGVSRDYILTVQTQREGSALIRLTFRDEDDSTEEYIPVEIMLKSVRAASQAPIEVVGPVRETGNYTVYLDGAGAPYGTTVNYGVLCTVPEIQFASIFPVLAGTKTPFHFEFTPLRVGESTGKLEFSINSFSSAETNTTATTSTPASSSSISYEIRLVGTQPRPEHPIVFQTYIGANQILPARFHNLTKSKAEFSCRVTNGLGTNWFCDKSITAAPLVEVNLDVTFEPIKLGVTRSSLILTSSLAGDYVFPLEGRALPPKPLGPFDVKAGATISLPFRNVFSDSLLFAFTTDNSAFHVSRSTEILKPKKDHKIVVGYDSNSSESGGGMATGKLMVTCVDNSGSGSVLDAKDLQWVFYLRGISAEK